MNEHRKTLTAKIAHNFETFPSNEFMDILSRSNWPNIRTGYHQFLKDEYEAMKEKGLKLNILYVTAKWNKFSPEDKLTLNEQMRDVEIENIKRIFVMLFEEDRNGFEEMWGIILPIMIQDLKDLDQVRED